VLCNAPIPFKVVGWSISLPSHLSLSEGGDINDSLDEMMIEYGEIICLTFGCTITSTVNDKKSLQSGSEAVLTVDLVNDYGTLFREAMKLENVPRFMLTSPDTIESSAIEAVSTTLIPSATEGLVGVPISFSAKFDCSNVPECIGEIVYKIDSLDGVWLVSGRVEGVLQRSPQIVEFVGIPSRPGILHQYPSIRLMSRKQAISYPIPVDMSSDSQRQPFKSLSSTSHTTIAFPLTVGNNKLLAPFAT
jgi:hypothetical protein